MMLIAPGASRLHLMAITRGRSGKSDAVALLRRDHERVSDLISQLERAAARSGGAARFLLEIIRTELHIHCAIERDLFYPAFRDPGRRRADDAALYWEALEHDRLVAPAGGAVYCGRP